MALDPTSQDVCGILNKASFPLLWINDSGNTFPINIPSLNAALPSYAVVAENGIPKTFINYLTGDLNNSILGTSAAQSEHRLVAFMSGGGFVGTSLRQALENSGRTSEAARYDFSKLQNILMGSFSDNTTNATFAPQTIVDTYIIGNESTKGIGKGETYKKGYKLASQESTFLSDSDVNKVIENLQRNKHLLTQDEIYISGQVNTQSVTAGSESLIYLYKKELDKRLSREEEIRRITLESKNLKFFAAFLAEYCFYKTRYIALMKQFFTIYTNPSIPETPFNSSPYRVLFTNDNNVDTMRPSGNVTKSDIIRILSYHMAVANSRMNDLKSLLAGINTYYAEVMKTIQADINSENIVGSNTRLQSSIKALNLSAGDATKYLEELDFSKGIIEYTGQKNRYGNVLLGLYTFLNISALAIIIHLYKS